MHRFDRDTALEPLGAGRYAGRLDRAWWISAGPNGGYLAALLMRGLHHTVDDAERHPRSFTVHFLERPEEGAVEVVTELFRRGRSLTSAGARLVQGERTLARALGAFARARSGFTFDDTHMPEAPLPDSVDRHRFARGEPPLRGQLDYRFTLGAPRESGAAEAVTGGWIRTAEPRALDAPLVCLLMDCWPPSAFAKPRPEDGARGAPTIDLTIHFRRALPAAACGPGAFVFSRFRSRLARDGFVEEDGELWAADGRLLAQSRQLAIFA